MYIDKSDKEGVMQYIYSFYEEATQRKYERTGREVYEIHVVGKKHGDLLDLLLEHDCDGFELTTEFGKIKIIKGSKNEIIDIT